MKQIEELMAMTTHANGMSFEKAEFVHLYRNRVFLAQEYVRGRMVFGELVRVLESDSGTAFIEKVLTVIRTSATELEAMKKICGDYTLCPDTADYILALRIDELTSLSLQKCQEALSYFEVMSSVSMSE
ncbi:MAG: hypothetical protein IKT87_02845 [Bacteroidaceae bacterium]|jgi:hypothetical protein|nr:hypothetical protein [Bacteroidaceae bacterium]MBR4160598.1 hypothetical protein [Bacteroidaceae bacterium]MEE0985422.1 hypothetical protein [Bacteroidaceae bacterium]